MIGWFTLIIFAINIVVNLGIITTKSIKEIYKRLKRFSKRKFPGLFKKKEIVKKEPPKKDVYAQYANLLPPPTYVNNYCINPWLKKYEDIVHEGDKRHWRK